MIPLIRLELHQRRYYTLWWTLALVALVALLIFIYPSIREHAQQLDQISHQTSSGLRALKGIGSSGDVAKPINYLNAQAFYVTLPMMFSILTIGLGSALLARDEQNKTIELILSRPISRAKVLAAKAISGLIITLVVTGITCGALILFAHLVDMGVAFHSLVFASVFCVAMAVALGAIAFAFTAASSGTRRISIAAAILIGFGGYILVALAKSTDALDFPSRFFPYYYYTPTDILNDKVSVGLVLFLSGLIVGSGLVAWLGFRRRDIE